MAFMMVNGSMIKSMAMANLRLPMAIFTKEIILKVNARVMVYSNGTMVICTKANFITIKKMVKENSSSLILKTFYKEHGQMTVLLVK